MGNYTNAYATITPFKDTGVSDYAQKEEELIMKRKVLADEKVKAQALAKAAKDKEANDFLSKLKPKVRLTNTGSQTAEEVMAKAVLDAASEMVVVADRLKKNPDDFEAQMTLENLNNFPANMDILSKTLIDGNAQVKKDLTEGKIWKNTEYLKAFSDGFSNKFIKPGRMGLPDYGFIDENKDGMNDIIDFNTATKNLFTDERFKHQPRFNPSEELKKDYESVGTEKVINDDGSTKITKVNIDKVLLKNYVDRKLYNPDGTPNDILKSFAREAKITDYSNTEALKKVRDDYENAILIHSTSENSTEQVSSDLEILKANREEARARKKEQETISTLTEVTEPQDYKVNGINIIPGAKVFATDVKSPVVKVINIGEEILGTDKDGKPIRNKNPAFKKRALQNTKLENFSAARNKDGQRILVGQISHEIQVPIKDEYGDDVLGKDNKPTYKSERRIITVPITSSIAGQLLPKKIDKNGNTMNQKDSFKSYKNDVFKDVPQPKTAKYTAPTTAKSR